MGRVFVMPGDRSPDWTKTLPYYMANAFLYLIFHSHGRIKDRSRLMAAMRPAIKEEERLTPPSSLILFTRPHKGSQPPDGGNAAGDQGRGAAYASLFLIS